MLRLPEIVDSLRRFEVARELTVDDCGGSGGTEGGDEDGEAVERGDKVLVEVRSGVSDGLGVDGVEMGDGKGGG